MHRRLHLRAGLLLAFCAGLLLQPFARADTPHHTLWRVAGKHNVVYLLGSIHVLRESDYPLPPALLEAYANSKGVVMEIDMAEMQSLAVQQEMMQAASLPEGRTLRDVLGSERFTRAQSLAARIGVPLETFEGFEPWFVAEAISQLQLMQLGFAPSAGVESFFLERAHADGKTTQGLETAHDQIELFEAMPLERQAQYLLASLEESGTLPAQVDAMVAAWRAGDSGWFAKQMQSEFGRDPRLYQSLLAERNRKWVPKIEALLREDRNYLVIVGTGHLAGRDSVVELLQRDGFTLTQQ